MHPDPPLNQPRWAQFSDSMKKLLSPKKGGGALVDTHSSSGVELRGLGGDAAPSWDADAYTNPFADEPFTPYNPFLDAAAAPGSRGDHDLVEEILRDHQGLGPAAAGASTSEAGFHRRSRSPAGSSDLGRGAAATAGAAGVGDSTERLGSMHDVPLYDAAAVGDTAPHSPSRPWPRPTAASAATAAVAPPPRLPLGPLASGGSGGGGSNPFLESAAALGTSEQHPPGSSSNPFLLEEDEEPVLLHSPPSSSSWSKKESTKGAAGGGRTGAFAPSTVQPFELATPQPQPASSSRRGVLASEWEGPAPASRSKPFWSGLRLWGGKKGQPPASPTLPVSAVPPAYGGAGWAGSNGTAGSIGTEGAWAGREALLERREAAVERREAEVARREAVAARTGGGKPKNWPRCYPLLHHDIGGEVPAGRQALVRTSYLTWLLVCTAYLYNWLVITVMFAAGEKKVSLWLFASLVAGFGVPLSFLCWYRGLYFAAIRDGARHWAWFFMHMLANLVWDWWMFVGIQPSIGGYSAGLFTMIEQFSHGGGKGTAFGILSIINMALWGLGGTLTLYLLGWALRVFRGRGSATSPGSSGTNPRGRGSSGGAGTGGRRAVAAAVGGSRRSTRGAAAAPAAPAP